MSLYYHNFITLSVRGCFSLQSAHLWKITTFPYHFIARKYVFEVDTETSTAISIWLLWISSHHWYWCTITCIIGTHSSSHIRYHSQRDDTEMCDVSHVYIYICVCVCMHAHTRVYTHTNGQTYTWWYDYNILCNCFKNLGFSWVNIYNGVKTSR